MCSLLVISLRMSLPSSEPANRSLRSRGHVCNLQHSRPMTLIPSNPAYPLAAVTPFMTNETCSASLSRTPPFRTLLSWGLAVAAPPPAGLHRLCSCCVAFSSNEDKLERLRCRLTGARLLEVDRGFWRAARIAIRSASRASSASNSSAKNVGATVHDSSENLQAS